MTGGFGGLKRRQAAMLGALAALLLIVQIDQPYPDIAPLQHLPTLALLLASPFLLRRWPLSDSALACILLFLALHTIGGRWTYSNVPYDSAARALTGHSIGEAFGFTRNHYDRLVHFAFGALTILPLAEALRRGRFAIVVAVLSVLAASALYEIFEWLLAVTMQPALADQYNGQQGDIWDSQKDMAMAALGAFASAAILWRRQDA